MPVETGFDSRFGTGFEPVPNPPLPNMRLPGMPQEKPKIAVSKRRVGFVVSKRRLACYLENHCLFRNLCRGFGKKKFTKRVFRCAGAVVRKRIANFVRYSGFHRISSRSLMATIAPARLAASTQLRCSVFL